MSTVRSAIRARRKGLAQVPWLLAVPGLVAVFAFHYAPVVAGGYFAFTKWNGVGHASWVGLDNFRAIFADRTARGALWHSLELTGVFVVAVNAIGLTLALALNRALKTRHLLRLVFFAPVVMSSLAITYIWRWIFDYYGALNSVLAGVGLESWQRTWTGDRWFALATVLIVMIWQYSGLVMVLFLAGLQGISDDVYEATLVDGASAWLRLRKVVLPLLAPALTISVTITLIHGLRVFDQVIALTNGGPVDSSETLATQVYKQTFGASRYGYGAALALILTLLITVVALIQLVVLRRNEERL